MVLPFAHDLADRQHDLLAVTENCGVDEVGDGLGIERGVSSGEHQRVSFVAVDAVQRDAGQIEGGQHVGVAEFGGEADPEQVELRDRAVVVDGELADLVLAHHLFHVREHRVGALGQDPVPLVEYLVQDRDALVGQAHLVRVRIHQRPADLDAVPVLDD